MIVPPGCEMNTSSFPKYIPAATFLVAVLVYFLAAQITSDGIWVNDEGNRMLAVKAWSKNAGFVRDPLRETPLPGVYSYCPESYFVLDPASGKVISAYSPVFPRVMAPLYKWGGFPLVRCVVLLAGLLCVCFLWLTARRLTDDPLMHAATILIAALGTPLVFYSGLMFELSLAAALVAGAVYCIVADWNRFLLAGAAGLLLGISVWFREEGYVFAIAAIAAFLFCRVKWHVPVSFTAGFLLCAVPLWILNYRVYETIFGLHHLVYQSLAGDAPGLLERLYSWYYFVFQPNISGNAGLVMGVIFIASLVYGFLPDNGVKRIQVKTVIGILTALCALVNFLLLVRMDQPVESVLLYQSLLATTPLAVIPALFGRTLFTEEDKRVRFLLVLTILSVIGITVSLQYQLRGIFFGARHYMLILPVTALLAVYAFCRMRNVFPRHTMIALSLLLLCSVFSQLYGLHLRTARKQFSHEVVHTCRILNTPLIATDVFFVPEELAGVPDGTAVVYLTGDPAGPGALTAYADHKGYRRIHLITGGRFSAFSGDKPLGMYLNGTWTIQRVRSFEDKRMGFLTLHLWELNRR